MKIKFLCRESKARKNGTAPIELSIIINRQRCILSLEKYVEPAKFDVTKQKVKGDKDINDYLNVIIKKCHSIEIELLKQNKLSLTNFINYYKGKVEEDDYTLLKLYDKHNQLYKEKYNNNIINYTSYYKYLNNKKRIESFLKEKKLLDIKLIDITPFFVEEFKNYCLKHLNTNTTNKELKMLKKILTMAVDEGILKTSPFKLVISNEKMEYDVVDYDTIISMYNKEINDARIEQIRDIFILQCFTGMAYVDLMSFRKEMIQDDIILINRKKTNVQSIIPLLDITKEILIKYDYELPLISNQKYNMYLKVLGDYFNLNISLHSHLARHSFACMLINRGVNLKTIASALGHSSVKITESVYAQMTKRTIVDNIKKVF